MGVYESIMEAKKSITSGPFNGTSLFEVMDGESGDCKELYWRLLDILRRHG